MAKPMPTLKECIQLQAGFDGLANVHGKPQKLYIDNGTALYWLEGTKQELFSVSLTDANCVGRRVIVTDEIVEAGESKPMSKEEELLRERLRNRLLGISHFHVRSADGVIFFASGVSFFYYNPGSKKVINVFESITDTAEKAFVEGKTVECIGLVTMGSAPTVATPARPTILSFVCGYNVFMALITEIVAEGGDVTLTVSLKRITAIGSEKAACGTADYIIQEEFARYTGHYANDKYVLYSYTNTSMLNEVMLISAQGKQESIPYPFVGDPNAQSVIAVYERNTGQYRVLPPAAIKGVAPWVEYMPRFGFKDVDTIYVSVLSRDQERYCVLSCSVSALPVINETDLPSVLHGVLLPALNMEGGEASLTVEWEQDIPWAWVDIGPGKPIEFGTKFDFLCCHAEKTPTAHRHIFFRPSGASKHSWKQLTDGEFNVSGRIRVTMTHVFFTANAEDRIESALYAIQLPASMDEFCGPYSPRSLRRITPINTFLNSFSVANGVVCAVTSTATQFAQIHVIPWTATTPVTPPVSGDSVVARVIQTVWFKTMMILLGSDSDDKNVVLPHIITVKNARGVPLSSLLFVSQTAEKPTPAGCPVAMYVYGGPHVQLVHRYNVDTACNPLIQTLLKAGISVLVSDNQMSHANGLRAHSICKKNMGRFETEDFACIARAVTARMSKDEDGVLLPEGWCADPTRIAIFGWSYGGYATLLAMSQAPQLFKLGFSGAPVSDWRLYDTGYTERYMGVLYADGTSRSQAGVEVKDASGHPKAHSAAYEKGSVRAFANGFPDEINRVFIAHGLLDENVHFFNSCDVANAMVDAGKPYSMSVYPGERHSLRIRPVSRLHYNAQLICTMKQLL